MNRRSLEVDAGDPFRSQDKELDRQDQSLLASIPASSEAMVQLRSVLLRLGDANTVPESAKEIIRSVLSKETPLARLLDESVISHLSAEGSAPGPARNTKESDIRWV